MKKKKSISTFCWFVSVKRPFSPLTSIRSIHLSSDIRKFTRSPPLFLKLFYKNMTGDNRRRCQIWSHHLNNKSTKIQSEYVYIHFIYRFRSFPGTEALIYTDLGWLWVYWVQTVNQSNEYHMLSNWGGGIVSVFLNQLQQHNNLKYIEVCLRTEQDQLIRHRAVFPSMHQDWAGQPPSRNLW